MAMKGLFFTVDALFGVIIAAVLIAAFSYTMIRSQEDNVSQLFLSRLADDALAVMDKNDTLDILDDDLVSSVLTKILPSSVDYTLDVKVFQCGGSDCSRFDEQSSESFKINSGTSAERSPAIAKRSFLTFDDNRVKYFNKAELRVWLR